MIAILSMLYLWLKTAHIIFVIFWMAGLFMLPRFFIYHQECEVGSEEDGKWIERENKLRKIILTPSLIIVWLLGLSLTAVLGPAVAGGWFGLKILAVLGLTAYHGVMAGYAKKLARGERPYSDKKLRLLNEVPGLAVALIVILVVVKPF